MPIPIISPSITIIVMLNPIITSFLTLKIIKAIIALPTKI